MVTRSALILLVFSLSLPGLSNGSNFDLEVNDPVASLLNEAKIHFERGDEDKAHEIYLSILEKEPDNYEALWNTSFIYTRKARRQIVYTSQEAIYRTALAYARLCLEKHPDKPRSHYVVGLASAGLADDMPNSSERFKLIWDMKEYAYRAVEMDPEFAPAWHLVGIWHSKLANISRTERLAARIIYGSLPDGASNKKAEEYLNRAINMDQNVILFKLDLAQQYQETGQIKKAIQVLETILEMQPVSLNDVYDYKEARERYEQLI
jgi:tetratricopeptide (TPR) repeat protein